MRRRTVIRSAGIGLVTPFVGCLTDGDVRGSESVTPSESGGDPEMTEEPFDQTEYEAIADQDSQIGQAVDDPEDGPRTLHGLGVITSDEDRESLGRETVLSDAARSFLDATDFSEAVVVVFAMGHSPCDSVVLDDIRRKGDALSVDVVRETDPDPCPAEYRLTIGFVRVPYEGAPPTSVRPREG